MRKYTASRIPSSKSLDQNEIFSEALLRLDRLADALCMPLEHREGGKSARIGPFHITLIGEKAGMWFVRGKARMVFGTPRRGGNLAHLVAAADRSIETYPDALEALSAILGGVGAGKARRPKRRVGSQDEVTLRYREEAKRLYAMSEAGRPEVKAWLTNLGLEGRLPEELVSRLRYVPDRRSGAQRGMIVVASDDGAEAGLVALPIDPRNIDEPAAAITPLRTRSVGQMISPVTLREPLAETWDLVIAVGLEAGLMAYETLTEAWLWAVGQPGDISSLELPDHARRIAIIASDIDSVAIEDATTQLRCMQRHILHAKFPSRLFTKGQRVDLEEARETLIEAVTAARTLKSWPRLTLARAQYTLEKTTARFIERDVFRVNALVQARLETQRTHGDQFTRASSQLEAFRRKLEPGSDMYIGVETILGSIRELMELYPSRARESFDAKRDIERFVLGQRDTERPGGIVGLIGRTGATTEMQRELAEIYRAIEASPGDSVAMIEDRYARIVTDAGLPMRPNAQLLLATPGLGKTRSTSQIIAATDPMSVVWVLQPTGVKSAEFESDIRRWLSERGDDRPVTYVRGRGADRPDRPGKMCERHEAAAAVAVTGRSVSQTMCRGVRLDGASGSEIEDLCPFYERCAYIAQRDTVKDLDHGVFILSHAALLTPTDAPKPDFIIVDEDFTQQLTRVVEVSADAFRLEGDHGAGAMEALAMVAADPDVPSVTPDLVDDIRRILELVLDTLRGEAPLAAMREHFEIETLSRTAKALSEAERALSAGIFPGMPDDEIAELIEAAQASGLRKLAAILRGIVREMKAAAEWEEEDGVRATFNGIVYNPNAKVVIDGGKTETVTRVTAHYLKKMNDLPWMAPVLILDGTADTELLQIALGEKRDLEVTRIDAERQGEVIHVIGKGFSTTSITGRGRDAEWLENSARLRGEIVELLHREAQAAPNGVFVAAPKTVREFLAPEIPTEGSAPEAKAMQDWRSQGIHWGHYGATRGINAWERCDTAVLLGRKQPPPEAVEGLARCFYATDPKPIAATGTYVTEERAVYTKDGARQVLNVRAHADPRVQRVLWAHREAELLQALDRVRAVRNVRRIVILGDVDLQRPDDGDSPRLGLPVDVFTRWRGLRLGTRQDRILEEHGFLPLSKTLLALVASDEVPNVDAGKKWLQREREALEKWIARNQLITLSVRIAGQRGTPGAVAVDPSRFATPAELRVVIEAAAGCAVTLADLPADQVWGPGHADDAGATIAAE